jgi:hypothetical protein
VKLFLFKEISAVPGAAAAFATAAVAATKAVTKRISLLVAKLEAWKPPKAAKGALSRALSKSNGQTDT